MEVIKCRTHPSQIADLILSDSNEIDLFKCLLCVRKNASLASKVIPISSIFAEEKDGVALDLCCDDSGIYEEAE